LAKTSNEIQDATTGATTKPNLPITARPISNKGISALEADCHDHGIQRKNIITMDPELIVAD